MEINKDITYVKPETYRIISIQNKEVLDIIETQGVYRPLMDLVRWEELKIMYEDMIRLMYKSIPIEKPYTPVWGFYRMDNELPQRIFTIIYITVNVLVHLPKIKIWLC